LSNEAFLLPVKILPSPLAGEGRVRGKLRGKINHMIQSDITLDTLGYFCPMPIILTSKKIKELTMGQVLEVLSDDEGIKKDMPAWCQTTGHEWVGLEEEETNPKTVYKVYVKKTK